MNSMPKCNWDVACAQQYNAGKNDKETTSMYLIKATPGMACNLAILRTCAANDAFYLPLVADGTFTTLQQT